MQLTDINDEDRDVMEKLTFSLYRSLTLNQVFFFHRLLWERKVSSESSL